MPLILANESLSNGELSNTTFMNSTQLYQLLGRRLLLYSAAFWWECWRGWEACGRSAKLWAAWWWAICKRNTIRI